MKINFIEALINIALAAFGGLVRRLSEIEKNPGKKATRRYYMVGSFISMFTGVVVYFICKNFNVSQFLTAGLTSLSGYIGSPVLDLLSDIAKKRIEKETCISTDKDTDVNKN